MSSVLAKVTMRAVLNGNKVKQTQTDMGPAQRTQHRKEAGKVGP